MFSARIAVRFIQNKIRQIFTSLLPCCFCIYRTVLHFGIMVLHLRHSFRIDMPCHGVFWILFYLFQQNHTIFRTDKSVDIHAARNIHQYCTALCAERDIVDACRDDLLHCNGKCGLGNFAIYFLFDSHRRKTKQMIGRLHN